MKHLDSYRLAVIARLDRAIQQPSRTDAGLDAPVKPRHDADMI
jgi:hypothetical protein